MTKEDIVPIAVSEGVTIHCPRDKRFSFFNSPYPAHYTYTGIDVYSGDVFGDPAPSPVNGRVVDVKRLKCPKGKGFKDSGFDCVILLKSLENPKRLIKILHVAPTVKCGEVVEPGQELGRFLRSGYFDFWTDPHLHVEVRKPSDPIRARGGLKLESLVEVDEIEPIEELRGTVIETKPEYSLVALKSGVMKGILVDVGGLVGLLDGGLPHYGWVGVHARGPPPVGGAVKLCGKQVATIKTTHHRTCLAKCTELRFKVGGAYMGLSLFLFPASEPLVKLVPPKLGALMLKGPVEISLITA